MMSSSQVAGGKVDKRHNGVTMSDIKTSLPKLWIAKMRASFMWLDVDGDGLLTDKDAEAWPWIKNTPAWAASGN